MRWRSIRFQVRGESLVHRVDQRLDASGRSRAIGRRSDEHLSATFQAAGGNPRTAGCTSSASRN